MVLIFSCTPVRKVRASNLSEYLLCLQKAQAWDPLIPGRCHNSSTGYVSGTINLVSDIAVLLLPVIGVTKLQMKTRKKVAVSTVFATGLMYVSLIPIHECKANRNSACGVSTLRLYYSSYEAKCADKTYWLALVGLCGAVEIAMVILCGCFTSFPRFLKWVRGERIGSQRYGSQRYKRSYGFTLENQSRSYGYASESQSRLRYEVPIPMELGRMGVTNQVRAAHQDWSTLR